MDLGLDQISGQLDQLAKLPKAVRIALDPADRRASLVIGLYALPVMYLPAKAEKLDATSQEKLLQLQRKLQRGAGGREQTRTGVKRRDRRCSRRSSRYRHCASCRTRRSCRSC